MYRRNRGPGPARTGPKHLPSRVRAGESRAMNRWARCRRAYDVVWSTATGTVIALGLVASFRDPGALSAIALFLAATTMGVVCVVTVASLITPDAVSARRTAVGGLVTGVLTLALVGLAALSGPVAFWLVTVLCVVWPGWRGLVRRVRRTTQGAAVTVPEAERENGSRRTQASASSRAETEPRPGRRPVTRPGSKARTRSKHSGAPAHPPVSEPTPVADDATLEVPDVLEDADLCLAWCSSYVALQRAKTAESRLRLVTVRALYLDELERRNPSALAAWLSNGARAAAPPHAFVKGGGHRSAAS